MEQKLTNQMQSEPFLPVVECHFTQNQKASVCNHTCCSSSWLAFTYSYKWTAGSYRMDVEVLHFFGCQKSLERLEKAQQRSQKTVGQNKLEKDKTSDARQQGNVIDISITIIISQ